MAYKLVTTKINNQILCALIDEKDRLIEVHPFDEINQSIVGNIYIGMVKNIKKNINSAFVDVGLKGNVYISMNESKNFYYAKRQGKNQPLVQGDEILVQIQKDAHKTKLAKGVTDLSLTGKYVILTTDRPSVFVSSKIKNDKVRLELKHYLRQYVTNDFGFIARTNCAEVDLETIGEEVIGLVKQYNDLMDVMPFRTKGQLLLGKEAAYLTLLNELYDKEVDAYLYDDEDLYNSAVAYLSKVGHGKESQCTLLDSSSLPYSILLGIEQKVQKLLNKKVWLKSGASIIIEPTEAMTVIDVNTEKSISKKNIDETIVKTNFEAADEIGYQLRARNISGIIIVDFIDMKDDKNKKKLLKYLQNIVANDPMKTTVIGMTSLGLVEITRKKKKATLAEQWR